MWAILALTTLSLREPCFSFSLGAEGGPLCKICPIILTFDHHRGPQGGLENLDVNFKYGQKSFISRCRPWWLLESFTIIRLVSNTSNPNISGTRNMNMTLFQSFEFILTPLTIYDFFTYLIFFIYLRCFVSLLKVIQLKQKS